MKSQIEIYSQMFPNSKLRLAADYKIPLVYKNGQWRNQQPLDHTNKGYVMLAKKSSLQSDMLEPIGVQICNKHAAWDSSNDLWTLLSFGQKSQKFRWGVGYRPFYWMDFEYRKDMQIPTYLPNYNEKFCLPNKH